MCFDGQIGFALDWGPSLPLSISWLSLHSGMNLHDYAFIWAHLYYIYLFCVQILWTWLSYLPFYLLKERSILWLRFLPWYVIVHLYSLISDIRYYYLFPSRYLLDYFAWLCVITLQTVLHNRSFKSMSLINCGFLSFRLHYLSCFCLY